MPARLFLCFIASATLLCGVTAAAPPVSLEDVYRYDRKAVDHDFDRREDALRDSYKALRQQEEDAWRHARKTAPPPARKHITQQYVQRRKDLARDYVARRKALDDLEDRTRDSVRGNYAPVPLQPVYPPAQYDNGNRYEQRYSPPPRRYEELPPPPVVIPPPGSREI